MSETVTATKATAQPPSLIHVAGNLIVNLAAPARAESALDESLKSAIKQSGRQPYQRDAGPAIIIRDDDAPWKIMQDGQRVDARDAVSDHLALLFPDTGWYVGVNALTRDGEAYASQQDVAEAATRIILLDRNDWGLASDKVYERHVIDRRFWQPTLDKNLYPNLPTNDWYWTSTIVPGDPARAFYVSLLYGNVSSYHRNCSGFGLPCCRARQ